MRIGIAGAGIMGRLIAWEFVNNTHLSGDVELTIFDQDPIDNGRAAAYTAAGMLTPYSEVESAEWEVYRLGMQGLSLWPKIMKSLGSDLGFHQLGSLIVSHPHDVADLERFKLQLTNKLGNNNDEIKLVGKREIHQLEPMLSEQFNQGVFLPKESWLCTKCVMRSLADYLLSKRVSWHSSSNITDVGEGIISVGRRQHEFDVVIDCRGLGAKQDLKGLRGVRGELIWIESKEVKINRMVRLMHPRYRLYLVPKKDSRFVIGATQIETEDYSPISVRSSLELLSALYSIHPAFAEARILESKTNCRPALIDNLPKIEDKGRLISVNGLYRHGFLLAPVLAKGVINLISGEKSNTKFVNELLMN